MRASPALTFPEPLGFGVINGPARRRRPTRYPSTLSGTIPREYRKRDCVLTWESLSNPEGASRTKDDSIWGKYEAKEAAMPPPREYPARQKRPDPAPVHEMEEEFKARKICVENNRSSWGRSAGQSE